MVEKLSKFLCQNRQAVYAASGAAFSVLAASQSMRMFCSTKTDPEFDKNKLSYSEECEKRAMQLSNVSYQMVLSLNQEEEKGYHGCIQASFVPQDLELQPLYLDFHGKSISQVHINGSAVSMCRISFLGHRIYLPKEYLKVGKENKVDFYFENSYVNNSAGLHYYKDPQDQKIYMYTHLEPFFCHRWFPCFDQPSVKAPLKLYVITPVKDWKVIANGKEATPFQASNVNSELGRHVLSQSCFPTKTLLSHGLISDSKDGFLWEFAKTPKQSSYIYAMCAGEFAQIDNDKMENANPVTPMRIFARQSKIQQVPADLIFDTNVEAIKFYEKLFSCKYPFGKYDVVYCPEFRIGAMENVGCTTFTDRLLVPENEQTNYNLMIHLYIHQHELAHTWFGDLTTMQWWNDLWLKESFADFCSATCFNECIAKLRPDDPVSQAAHHLFQNFLERGLEADLRQTTHPIRVPIVHTGDAVSAFDAISYEKGASWIKVMDYFIGRETIQKGLAIYVEKYGFKNSTLEQFVECLKKAYNSDKIDLQHWTDSWLKYKGCNEVSAEIEFNEGGEGTMHVRQGFAKNSAQIYRAQAMDLMLVFVDKDDAFKSITIPRIILEESELTKDIFKQLDPQTLSSLSQYLTPDGKLKQKPVAVMPNANNKGYCQVKLDEESLKHFVKFLSKPHISKANRAYLWYMIWDHILNYNLSPREYIDLFTDHFEKETEVVVLIKIVRNWLYILNHNIIKLQTDTEDRQIAEMVRKGIEEILVKNYQNESQRTQLINLYIALRDSSTDTGKDELTEMVTQSTFPFSQQSKQFRDSVDRKVITKAQRHACLRQMKVGAMDCDELFQKEFETDYSSQDDIARIRFEACEPTEKCKKDLWEKYLTKDHFKQQEFEYSAMHFYDHFNKNEEGHKRNWNAEFGDKFWEVIEKVEAEFDQDYFREFYHNLTPTFLGREEDLDQIKNLYQRYKENPEKTFFCKLLLEDLDELTMILDIRKQQKL